MTKLTVTVTLSALFVVIATAFLVFDGRPEDKDRDGSKIVEREDKTSVILQKKILPQRSANPSQTTDFVDWNRCIDDLHAPECIEAITPLIAEIEVVGDLGWLDLMDRLAVNTERVAASLSNPECTPPVSGFEPISDTAADHCAARAFGELGALLRGCSRSFDGRGDSYERRVGRANIAAERGVTDLSVLDALTQADRLDQLESAWLLARCVDIMGDLESLPALFAELDESPPRQPHTHEAVDYPWRVERLSAAYVERAVLAGDYRVAAHYYDANRRNAGLSNKIPTVPLRTDQRAIEEQARLFEANVEATIRRLAAHNPAQGYRILSEHYVSKFPDYSMFYPSKDLMDAIAIENSLPEVVSGETPKTYLVEEDWYQRTLDLLTYQHVAQRLSGIPMEVYQQNFDGFPHHDYPIFDELLDANDREYASQRANEIIAELNRKP